MTPGTAPSPTLRRTRGRWSRATESGFRSFPRLRGKAGMGAGFDAKLSGTAPGTAPSPALPRTRGGGARAAESGVPPLPRLRGEAGVGGRSAAGSRGLFELVGLAVLAELL